MSKFSILHTAIRRRRTQNSINTSSQPAIQVLLLIILPLDMQLPVLDTSERRGLLVHLHLGTPGLPRARELATDRLATIRDEHAMQQLGAFRLISRRPLQDLVPRVPQALDGRLQRPRHRRRGQRHPIVPHDSDAQFRRQRRDGVAAPPGNR